MSGEIRLQATTGLTIRGLIVGADGKIWSGSAMVFPVTLSDAEWTSALVACAERNTSDATGTGLYWANWPGALTKTAIYDVFFFVGAAPVPGDLALGHQLDPTEYILDRVGDVYHANIDFAVDADDSLDKYSIRWFKDDALVTSDITAPTIQVTRRADGTDLIALTDLIQIGESGAYRYDEEVNRLPAGEGAEVTVNASIDGSSRPWSRFISRDSFV